MGKQDAGPAESVRNRPLDRHSAPRYLQRSLPDSPDTPSSGHAADRGVVGCCGAVFAGVGAEPLEFIRVDSTHYPRREHALEAVADPAYAVPGGGDSA